MRFHDVIRMGLQEYYDELKQAVDGLTHEERRFMPEPDSHHIDFAVWHIARVEDAWINRFAKQAEDQVWNRGDWAIRLNLPVREIRGFGPESGWGWSGEQVRNMPAFEPGDLWDYLDAVRGDTVEYLSRLTKLTWTDVRIRQGPTTRSDACGATCWSRRASMSARSPT